LFPHILFKKYIYILSLEMASPENQHFASCIGTLSLPIDSSARAEATTQEGIARPYHRISCV